MRYDTMNNISTDGLSVLIVMMYLIVLTRFRIIKKGREICPA
jgi:hypothetical protein